MGAGLADVLPSVAAALGLPVRGPARMPLPVARSAVVVLVDGLGEELLAARGGHAPFLRSVRLGLGEGLAVDCGLPGTPATSIGPLRTAPRAGRPRVGGLNLL